MPTEQSDREDARQFLVGLKEYFNSKWRPDDVKRKMREAEEKVRSKNPKLRDFPHETFFSNLLVVPTINEYLQRQPFAAASPSEACIAFLAEGYGEFKDKASGSAMSAFQQPFTKQFDTVGKIVKSWWAKDTSTPNACPDFALRNPCPYKVVGETKYFRKGGIDAAKTELVRGIYQCFYYRGLPKMNKTVGGSSWDYDYACLLAYDASGNGALAKAWETLNPKVKYACWNGANVFVMVLPS